MTLPFSVLLEQLKAFNCENCTIDQERAFSAAMPFYGGELLSPVNLYVSISDTVPDDCPEIAFISIGKLSYSRENTLTLSEDINLFDVVTTLYCEFVNFSEFEVNLSRAALSGSYISVIKCFQKFTGSHVVFMDSGYRIKAMAPDVDVIDDPEWNYMRSVGFISLNLIQKLTEQKVFDVIKDKREATFYTTEMFHGFPYYGRIIDDYYLEPDSGFYARLLVLLSRKDERCFHAARVIKPFLTALMERDENLIRNRNMSQVEVFFLEILEGKKLAFDVDARLDYLFGKNNRLYRVLYIPLGSAGEQVNQYINRFIYTLKLAVAVTYHNDIVLILNYSSDSEFKHAASILRGFLENYSLVGIISNEFTDVTQLPDYYNQAVSVANLAKYEENLIWAEKHILRSLIKFLHDSKPFAICHSALTKLNEYDRVNGTELYKTLAFYLENESKLSASANMLYVHKNTLLFRLQKIKSIANIELENPDVRLHLILSFRIRSLFPDLTP